MLNTKIKYLITTYCNNDKDLFCLETKITRETLNKLLTGVNNNPTIKTINGIKNAYPNINLNWLISNDPTIDYTEILVKRENKEI
ncbi:MAG: hypothetical protein KFKLKKLM_00715 [Flavobacteriales bacterium]|nr:hypothetical protein [Flavobacteriales bacterium]